MRTAALFPMDATRESVKFAQQGNGNEFHLKINIVDLKLLRTNR